MGGGGGGGGYTRLRCRKGDKDNFIFLPLIDTSFCELVLDNH